MRNLKNDSLISALSQVEDSKEELEELLKELPM